MTRLSSAYRHKIERRIETSPFTTSNGAGLNGTSQRRYTLPGDPRNLRAHSMILVRHGLANVAYLLSLHGQVIRTPSLRHLRDERHPHRHVTTVTDRDLLSGLEAGERDPFHQHALREEEQHDQRHGDQ